MSELNDYSDGHGGYCANVLDDKGKEVILSRCMIDGSAGVTVAIDRLVKESKEVPTIGLRWMMIQQGIKAERMGIRLTNKAPAASAIVKREYGVLKHLTKAHTGIVFDMLLQFAQMKMREGEEE